MTLIAPPINLYSNFIMENRLMDDYETSFLYEWQTAEEDLEFLDYTYCFEGKCFVVTDLVIVPHIVSLVSNIFAS